MLANQKVDVDKEDITSLMEGLRTFTWRPPQDGEVASSWNAALVEEAGKQSPLQKDATEFEDDEDNEEEVPVPENGTWLISDAAYRGAKCVHIVGGCHRVPGVHHKLWTLVADPVCTSSFKKVCKICFPEGYPWEGITEVEAGEQEVELGMLGPQEGEDDTASEADSV